MITVKMVFVRFLGAKDKFEDSCSPRSEIPWLHCTYLSHSQLPDISDICMYA